MDTTTITALVIVFLVFISLVRREMLKEKVEKPELRLKIRRNGKRRSHIGRRVHEFHTDCMTEDKRHNEDRRKGSKNRRHKERRHNT